MLKSIIYIFFKMSTECTAEREAGSQEEVSVELLGMVM